MAGEVVEVLFEADQMLVDECCLVAGGGRSLGGELADLGGCAVFGFGEFRELVVGVGGVEFCVEGREGGWFGGVGGGMKKLLIKPFDGG